MKKIMVLATVLLMGSAYAQTNYDSSSSDYGTGSGWGADATADDSVGMGTGQGESAGGGNRHMFEFNADSSIFGLLSFDKSKTRGDDADNDTQLNLDLNYAYALPMMPKLQLGVRGIYEKDVRATGGDFENWGAQVGAIYNFSDDLQNSFYTSLYLGMLWNHEYGNAGGQLNPTGDDEVRLGTFAIGKRFNLERWGIKHVTYSPEIALQTRNSTTSSSFDYSQDLQIRFLQFSVFF